MKLSDINLAVVGLGYVGLPLAIEFGKVRQVLGYDLDQERINNLKAHFDYTQEVSFNEFKAASKLSFTNELNRLEPCNCYIIAVPTPINQNNQPDLESLMKASEAIGSILKKNDIVIYESTVYPGCTEEECIPVLEKSSGLTFNKDFFCGYSPERINPGDKLHRISQIKKVTSGSTKKVAKLIDDLYRQIITAGTYAAPSIKVAEAAKVIENTQRDLNIALFNELAIIFDKLDIDTKEVIDAAKTKWNFIPFEPGLVGGHCIGVDPYYLTHKAQSVGYNPEIILAGRKLNDGMGKYIATRLMATMRDKSLLVKGSNILVMGLTFKENCPDLRNTKVLDVVTELENFKCKVDVYDPLISIEDAREALGITVIKEPKMNNYDAIILAVAHDEFKDLGIEKIRLYAKKEHVVYDLKHMFFANESDLRL